MSLIDGSYEYYHYLHDGIDDNVISGFSQPIWVLNCYFGVSLDAYDHL